MGSKFCQTSLINFLHSTKCEIIKETVAHQKAEIALNQTPVSYGREVPGLLDGDEAALVKSAMLPLLLMWPQSLLSAAARGSE